MMKYIFLFLFFLTQSTLLYGQNEQKHTLNGQIADANSGEDLISATIYVPELNIGATTNVYGFYSLTLPKGSYEIVYSYIGFENQVLTIDLTSDVTKNIELTESGSLMGEVVISAEKDEVDRNVTSTEMSVEEVSIETVKKLPALFGEIDIIKVIQLLPGVKSVGEGSSGFYVRGGNVDQNLVLLDEAPIYNASHVLGFFSSFNPDAIKDMKLYKGAIPSHFGGRLSSVLDIRMKEGNSKKFAGSGGIGTLMSRLALEAPLGDLGSFMVAGRRSYIDLVGQAVQSLRNEDSNDNNAFYFYDLNAKANYRINPNNRIFASGYFGRDVLGFNDDDNPVRIEWGNSTGTLRWNHLFSPKLFSNLTYYYSNYDYLLDFESNDIARFKWTSRLKEHSLKFDLGAYVNPNNTIRFGVHTIQHNIAPGNIETFEDDLVQETFEIQKNKSYESAAYINNEQVVTNKLKIDYGLRLSMLNNVGPQDVYNLDDDFELVDTTSYSGVYNTYWNLEPRVGVRYTLNGSSSIKASYNRTTQYIQLASNGNTATPFDIWFSSSKQIRPQLADQIALGYFKNFRDNAIEFSAEVYYKKFQNSIDFKDHAQLLLNENLEAELRVGRARAYGLELMLKKNQGKFTGWISYTLSKVQKKIPTINNGDWYNAKYDKPHDLSVVGAYELNKQFSLGSSFVYSTGNAVTFPTGKYDFLGVAVPIYSERNDARLPDFHRLDFSLTYRSKKNETRRFKSEWVLSIYNVYNRRNAFSIDFKQEEANPNITYAERSSLFAIVPSLTYNLKF